jgi:large subunit ribosomal protein L14
MVRQQERIRITDSSGALTALVIRVLHKGSSKAKAKVGDQIIVAIKTARPNKKAEKGKVYKGIVIRTTDWIGRNTGNGIRFPRGLSSAILYHTDKNKLARGEFLAKRVFGPVAKELRERGQIKIVSLASVAL